MKAIIWSLMLTVCTQEDACFKQTIQWFENEPECLEFKALHESIPADGGWKTVDYTCQIVGAIGT
jgi:hypothetical protein